MSINQQEAEQNIDYAADLLRELVVRGFWSKDEILDLVAARLEKLL